MIDMDVESEGVWRYISDQDLWIKLFEIPNIKELNDLDDDCMDHELHKTALDSDSEILYILIRQITNGDHTFITGGYKLANIKLNDNNAKWNIIECKNENQELDINLQNLIIIQNEIHIVGNISSWNSKFGIHHLKWNEKDNTFEKIGGCEDNLFHAQLIYEKHNDILIMFGSVKYNAFDWKFYQYDFMENEWIKLRIKLPTKLRQSFGYLITLDQKIIFYGGIDHKLQEMNEIYVAASLINSDCYESKLKCAVKGNCQTLIASDKQKDKLTVIGYIKLNQLHSLSMDIIQLITRFYSHNQIVHYFHHKGHWIIDCKQCFCI